MCSPRAQCTFLREGRCDPCDIMTSRRSLRHHPAAEVAATSHALLNKVFLNKALLKSLCSPRARCLFLRGGRHDTATLWRSPQPRSAGVEYKNTNKWNHNLKSQVMLTYDGRCDPAAVVATSRRSRCQCCTSGNDGQNNKFRLYRPARLEILNYDFIYLWFLYLWRTTNQTINYHKYEVRPQKILSWN